MPSFAPPVDGCGGGDEGAEPVVFGVDGGEGSFDGEWHGVGWGVKARVVERCCGVVRLESYC